MDHLAGSYRLSRRKLGRLAAAIIILLTANVATLLTPRAISAQAAGIQSQPASEH
jgi:hypothetical protein